MVLRIVGQTLKPNTLHLDLAMLSHIKSWFVSSWISPHDAFSGGYEGQTYTPTNTSYLITRQPSGEVTVEDYWTLPRKSVGHCLVDTNEGFYMFGGNSRLHYFVMLPTLLLDKRSIPVCFQYLPFCWYKVHQRRTLMPAKKWMRSTSSGAKRAKKSSIPGCQ